MTRSSNRRALGRDSIAPMTTAGYSQSSRTPEPEALPEHSYIKACCEEGVWAPESDGLTIDYFPASEPVYKFIDNHARICEGKAPVWEYLLDEFPYLHRAKPCDKRFAVNQLLEKHRKKLIAEGARDIVQAVRNDRSEESLDAMRATLDKAVSAQPKRRAVPMSQIAEPSRNLVLPCLYPAIGLCGGISMGDYVVMLAWTNVGKSYRLLQHSLDMVKAGYRVYYYALEMNRMKMANRVHEMLLGGPEAILGLSWSQRMAKCDEALNGHLDELQFVDDEDGQISSEHIARTSEPGSIVVVDYITLMTTAKGHQAVEDWRMAASISNSLRRLTVSHGVTVLAAAQANRRGGESDEGPDSLTVGHTTAIAQDIDLGIALSRTPKNAPFITNKVFKSRHGSMDHGQWFTMFRPAISDFSEISGTRAFELFKEAKIAAQIKED